MTLTCKLGGVLSFSLSHSHTHTYVSGRFGTNGAVLLTIIIIRMAQYLEDRRDEVLVKGDKLEKGGWEDYLNS